MNNPEVIRLKHILSLNRFFPNFDDRLLNFALDSSFPMIEYDLCKATNSVLEYYGAEIIEMISLNYIISKNLDSSQDSQIKAKIRKFLVGNSEILTKIIGGLYIYYGLEALPKILEWILFLRVIPNTDRRNSEPFELKDIRLGNRTKSEGALFEYRLDSDFLNSKVWNVIFMDTVHNIYGLNLTSMSPENMFDSDISRLNFTKELAKMHIPQDLGDTYLKTRNLEALARRTICIPQIWNVLRKVFYSGTSLGPYLRTFNLGSETESLEIEPAYGNVYALMLNTPGSKKILYLDTLDKIRSPEGERIILEILISNKLVEI